ncbi:DEAD-domain-containing protein [Dendrothele bispora CBS 962.96]|uniref:RNA helicase n=1 Tax=Dendrothele bispora (strain CBS 962.96) TaxID=1314807 RepID=A0A4S8LJU9_DENBC|nr:DEAD-domain-containing protein [Dendrothele bispora CBS 962.96]
MGWTSMKKKKRKHAEVDEQPVLEDGEKKKKKKKEKHREVADAVETPVSDESKKDRKEKKEKKDKKKDKKDKKDKSKDSQESSSTSTPAPTTSVSVSISASAPPSQSEITTYLTKNNITIDQPSSSSKPEPQAYLQFDQLPVPSSLAFFSKNFKEPSPIQACTWPVALEGRDVVGVAETGSGKTLAFGIPALTRLISDPPSNFNKKNPGSTITTLILSPTRELALQTHDQLVVLGEALGIGCVAVFGGVGKEGQIKLLQNKDREGKGKVTRIIVGTPGRILDLMNDGVCDLSGVNFLVLDEADRMLDKGFEQDIRKIIGKTKQGDNRQTLMFSATWPEAVRRLATSFQRNPIRVTVGSDDLTANSRVEQFVEVLEDGRKKENRLFHHLRAFNHPKQPNPSKSKDHTESRILIFALYKAEAARLTSTLVRAGFATSSLHGDMTQSARLQALQEFKEGKAGLMVATDVAARGLDIPDVRAVINYTFPLTIEDYIHRIGRTGRGGKSGKSITFFTGENQEKGLAGELNRVLTESGFDCAELREKFPMTIKKKEHSAYGAFYRDNVPATTRKKIVF